MSKSKEEIFAKGKEKKEIKLFKRVEPDLYKHIMNAMDEYAQQEAIEFLLDTTGEMFKHNASQLYQQYLQSKTK